MKIKTSNLRLLGWPVDALTLTTLLTPLLVGGQTIIFLDLHPPGAKSSVAIATSGHQQVGMIDDHAAIWNGTPESALIIGRSNSIALNTTGSKVLAMAWHGWRNYDTRGSWTAGNDIQIWNATSDDWAMPPQTDEPGLLNGVHRNSRLISRVPTLEWYPKYGADFLWSTPGTFLNNDRMPPTEASFAVDACSDQQVGYYMDGAWNQRAGLWNGSDAAFVDLHPDGVSYSVAYATSGTLQGGAVGFRRGNFIYPAAAIWRGSKDSLQILSPPMTSMSSVEDVAGEWQVGWYFSLAGRVGFRAALWNGTAESCVDLNAAMYDLASGTTPSSYPGGAIARGIWADGRAIKVVGEAYAGGVSHAVVWIITLPDTESPVITDAAPSSNTLWPPNNKMQSIALDAVVADDSGEAVWGVVGIECSEPGVENDMQIVDDHTVRLRASRSGQGSGRTYTIWLQAIDAAENLSAPYAVQVVVPHDMRNLKN